MKEVVTLEWFPWDTLIQWYSFTGIGGACVGRVSVDVGRVPHPGYLPLSTFLLLIVGPLVFFCCFEKRKILFFFLSLE